MKLCTIEADLSRVPMLPRRKAAGKGIFYRIGYDIILMFGMTELKAQIAWKEGVSVVSIYHSNPTNIGLILRAVFLGIWDKVSFLKKISFLSWVALIRHIFMFTGVQLRLFMILIWQMMTLENCHHGHYYQFLLNFQVCKMYFYLWRRKFATTGHFLGRSKPLTTYQCAFKKS